MIGPTDNNDTDYPGAPAAPFAGDELTDGDLGIVSGGVVVNYL